MLKIELPFWMNRGELGKLAAGAQGFWGRVQEWLSLPLAVHDLETCPLALVEIEGWSRGIDRFDGEPEATFRKRVAMAKINALDAGMTAGMKRIFRRLGIEVIDIKERIDGENWDVVIIELKDNDLSMSQALLETLVRQYGLTCRQYKTEVKTIESVTIYGQGNSCEQRTHAASLLKRTPL